MVFQRLQRNLRSGEEATDVPTILTGGSCSKLEDVGEGAPRTQKMAFEGPDSRDIPGVISAEEAQTGAQKVLSPVVPVSEEPQLPEAEELSPRSESSSNSSSETSSKASGGSRRGSSSRGSFLRRKHRAPTRKKIIKTVADGDSPPTWYQNCVYSTAYEIYSAVLILVNAIFVGWQTEHLAASVGQPDAQEGFERVFFYVAQILFFLAFFLDLVMRWVADGFLFFVCSEEMHWNLLDIFVVSIGFLEVVTETIIMAGSNTGLVLTNFSVVRMIRVLRVVRIARVIRVLKAFRELRLMVASIVSSARNLLWVIMVLCVMLYVFGISFTSAVAMELESLPKDAEGTEDLRRYFGSLSSSILTLYSSMSGGEDWTVYYHVLERLPWPYQTLFLFFVTFAVFAVVNVVTGVFVDTAIEKNQSDKELAVQEELRNKRLRMNWIRDVFSELDSSGDGTVTQEEFESQLNHEAVIAYFNTLKLDVSDAKTLFRMLDSDGSDGVNIDEFVSGCYRLSGEATTLHTQVMQMDIKDMLNKMRDILEILEEIRMRRRGSRPSKLEDIKDMFPPQNMRVTR
mmetsp:Transcript_54406/g.121747  ORF Transcript_54406/g.121747 Transcript_54406/m.121747 type:complete len:569 (-) Transcript_54406:306-2012(-)